MSTRLAHIVIDSNDPPSLAGFWTGALDWRVAIDEPYEIEIEGGTSDVNIIFVPTAAPRAAKSRVHLDLTTTSIDHKNAKVDRLIELGASQVDIGQGDKPWSVMADPEGNEFCVLPPGYYREETGPVGAICLTPDDRASLSEFWAAASGWPTVQRGLHRGAGPFIVFGGGVPVPKTAKNRVHLDIAPPPGGDQQAEAERLIAYGAKRIDIGQGDVPWVVMSDREGNEFCILTPR